MQKNNAESAKEHYEQAISYYRRGQLLTSSDWAIVQNNYAVCLVKYIDIVMREGKITNVPKLAKMNGKLEKLIKHRNFIMRNRKVDDSILKTEKMLWLTCDKNKNTKNNFEDLIKNSISRNILLNGYLLLKGEGKNDWQRMVRFSPFFVFYINRKK